MSREVVYLMSGAAHCPYLLTSLVALRRHYFGPVVVHAWPESFPLVAGMAKDPRLGIEAVLREPAYRGKNDQFLDKIQLMQTPGPAVRVYLDADTEVVHKQGVEGLFYAAEQMGFAATQFCHWLSNGRVVRARLSRLLGKPGIDDEAVQRVMDNPLPSLNGGVLAAKPDSPVLPVWYDWAWSARDIFISDEAALHVMQRKFKGHFAIMEGGRWNASHRYWQGKSDPFIWHYHGDSNVRPDKSPKAVAQWLPQWQRALQLNYGGAASWQPRDCGNKFLASLKETDSDAPHPDQG